MAAAGSRREELLAEFLREAVYRSRSAHTPADPFATADSTRAGCGLGERPDVVLDLSPRAAELCAELWRSGLSAEARARVERVMQRWIERQDALDRQRNHFLKAFRQAHGADRRTYSAAEEARYRAGLDEINARSESELAVAALELARAAGATGRGN